MEAKAHLEITIVLTSTAHIDTYSVFNSWHLLVISHVFDAAHFIS